jgi:hypothetical protein
MFRRLVDGIFAIAGAAVLSQFPEFFRQYLQRLGGRLDQAALHEARIAAAAREHGLSIADFVQHLTANADAVVRSEGQNVLAALADVERLRVAYGVLAAAQPFERPLVWVRHFDEGVARATLDQFVPAVPLSTEGLLYAGLGMVIGLALLAGIERTAWALTRVARPRRS